MPLPKIETVSLRGRISNDFSGRFTDGSRLDLELTTINAYPKTTARVALEEYPCIIFNLPYMTNMGDKVLNFNGKHVLENNATAHLKIRKSDLKKLQEGSHNHARYTHIKFYYLEVDGEVLIEKSHIK